MENDAALSDASRVQTGHVCLIFVLQWGVGVVHADLDPMFGETGAAAIFYLSPHLQFNCINISQNMITVPMADTERKTERERNRQTWRRE